MVRRAPGVPSSPVPTTAPSTGSHPLPRPQSRLFSVSRLSSSCRSSGPVLRGASSLRAQEPLRDQGRAPEAPTRPRAPGQRRHCRGMGVGGAHRGRADLRWGEAGDVPPPATVKPHPSPAQLWQAAAACADRPEGDEVGVDEGRAEEGAQQPQDGGARGHVPPPDLGQEGLKQRRGCCSPDPPTPLLQRPQQACPSGFSGGISPPSPEPPGPPSWGRRNTFPGGRPGSGLAFLLRPEAEN